MAHVDPDRQFVAASKLANMGYCETQTLLRAQHGDRVTGHQKVRRVEGKAEHARFHHQAVSAHNIGAVDKRCFIASAACGENDATTIALRAFRDRQLLPYRTGRSLVAFYYVVSPTIAKFLARSPKLRQLMRHALNALVRRIRP